MEMMQTRNSELRKENIALRLKYEALKKFAHENKIAIPPELQNP